MLTLQITHIKFLLAYIVDGLPGQKLEQIKTLRGITGLGLKESKDLIEAEHERRGERACPITRELVAQRDRLRFAA